jgi:phosphoribosylamine--glycine ligase
MKVLVIDVYGTGVDFCVRAQWEGHDVKHFVSPGKRPNIGKGLTHRVNDWRSHMRWADLIVCTASAKYGWEMEDYYEKGFPIFGANEDCAKWELDRCVGQSILEQHGIACLPYRRFDSYPEAIAHVRSTGGEFACKPIGDADRALSYVGKGPADMVSQLERAASKGAAKQPFILQKKAEGVEFAVGGWFGPHGFNNVWEENFEHKKLMAHDIGMNTGEMGTAMKYCRPGQSKLGEEMLRPLERTLKAMKFCGNIDVSVMIDDKGRPWPLEFTMRMGWPAFYLNQHLHQGDSVQWMFDLVNGEDTLKVSYDHCIGVCVCGPTFPHAHVHHDEVDGIPIFGVNPKNIENIHLVEVQAGKADTFEGGKWETKEIFCTAGEWLLVSCGTGSCVSDAKEEAYSHIKSLIIPNSPTYRHDIGDRCKEHIPQLKALGYARSWVY